MSPSPRVSFRVPLTRSFSRLTQLYSNDSGCMGFIFLKSAFTFNFQIIFNLLMTLFLGPTSTSSPAYATFASSFAYITAEIAMKSLSTYSAQFASEKYVFVSPTVSHTETIRITSTTPLSKPVTVMTQNVSIPVVTTQNISSTPVLTNQNVSTTVVTNSQNINSSRVLNSQQATTSSVTPGKSVEQV